MKQARGFTLVELIIVIVILGILAVTAAPRFIDIQSDAKASALDGVKAAVQGASQLVYAKAAIGGVQSSATSTVTIAGQSVAVVYGYPDASAVTSSNITNFVDISTTDFRVFKDTADAANAGFFYIALQDSLADSAWVTAVTDADTSNDCHVRYSEPASAGAVPEIRIFTTGC